MTSWQCYSPDPVAVQSIPSLTTAIVRRAENMHLPWGETAPQKQPSVWVKGALQDAYCTWQPLFRKPAMDLLNHVSTYQQRLKRQPHWYENFRLNCTKPRTEHSWPLYRLWTWMLNLNDGIGQYHFIHCRFPKVLMQEFSSAECGSPYF
jgi:hypothetical protein